MAISVTCEYCNKTMKVSDSLAGKRGKCPSCKNKINVPGFGSGAYNKPAGGDTKAGVVPCANCGNELINDADIEGHVVACPHCGTHLQMPPLAGVSSAPAFLAPAQTLGQSGMSVVLGVPNAAQEDTTQSTNAAFPDPQAIPGYSAPEAFGTAGVGVDPARESFVDAAKQTIWHVLVSLGQIWKAPLRITLVTVIFVLASYLALTSCIALPLFPVFVMGYVASIRGIVEGEQNSLDGFIGFMRHGWDTIWHLLMMLAAFFVTLAALLAPFFLIGLLLYLLLGTVGVVITEAIVHNPDAPGKLVPNKLDPINLKPAAAPNQAEPSEFSKWVVRAYLEIMGLGLKAILTVIAVIALTPIAAAVMLFFYLVLEVSRGRPSQANRFDLVYDAFGKMLRVGRVRWKQLLMGGFSLSFFLVGIVGIAFLVEYMLSKGDLSILAAWVGGGLLRVAMCCFVVYANVFMTIASLGLDSGKTV